MDRQRSSRQRLARSRAVESPGESSSADEAADPQSLGSRMRLLRRGKSASRRSRSTDEPENSIVQVEAALEEAADQPSQPPPPPPPPTTASQPAKESSGIARSIKRGFGFFRRSEREKASEDPEAALPPASHDTPEPEKPQTLDVVVDVHCENENGQRAPGVIKKTVTSKSEKRSDDERKRSPPEMIVDSLDLIEEARDSHGASSQSPRNGFFESAETVQEKEEEEEESEVEIPLASGGESSRRRKRWEKTELTADELVDDLTKPRRRKWAQGAASAEIRNVTGQRIVLPKRSATAEPFKQPAPRSTKAVKPVAAPRSKSLKKEEDNRGFDNEGFSSDHDEVLRVETINDQSPRIEIGSAKVERIEEGAATLSEEESKPPSRKTSVQEIEELPGIGDTTEQSDVKELSLSETVDSPEFMGRKSTARRRSRSKRKFSIEKKSEIDDEEDEVDDDDEEEQETVMNVVDKKSKRASSSKIEILSSTSLQKGSSDETTISTNEDMHTSRRDTHRSRSKSKSSRHGRSDDASAGSSRARRRTTTTSSSTRNSAEELSSGRRSGSARSRRKKRHKRRDRARDEPAVEQVEEGEEEEEVARYVSVKVHRSDVLEADYVTRHPMVIVHLVDAGTGEYLKKRDGATSRAVQPILTGKFDFAEKRSMTPVWEEELIFELDFAQLLQEGKHAALVLFEIIDLLSFDEASVCYDQYGKDACWYKVAWAFLRPLGVSGVQHVEKRVRLQLYRPKKTFRKHSKNKCEVYKWWKSNSRVKYPSSLYVTVSSVEPPKLVPVLYEQPLDTNEALEMHSESRGQASAKIEEPELSERPKWTRHAAQSCQIPNDLYFETEASDNGCFYLVFSNDGKYLACAMSEEYEYSIVVYKIDEGKIHVRFSGHKNFIYSLSWSHDNRYLLSVSSDQTARFWDVREKIIEHVQSLPHPSYVYCGQFSRSTEDLVVTGCYDHVARVWARGRDAADPDRPYELVQELEAHQGFVNCVCFQPRGDGFLTGDCLGVVAVWAARRSRRSPIRTEWQLARKIKIREIEGVPVNGLLMHPLGSRLLVHSRNSGLRLVDLVSGVVVKKFEGLTNQRIQLTGCISPCGGLLFCGSEDSRLLVWHVDSGRLLARYEPACQDKAIACVDYHPYDHALAYATYGAPVPVRLLRYDRDADGRAVGLRLLVPAAPASGSASARHAPRHLELSARSLTSSANPGSLGHLLAVDYGEEDDEARRHLKGRLQRFIEAGPNLKAKSMNRLNGIIEKIDRILMYATSQKSPANDLESARQSSVFAFEEPPPPRLVEAFEMENVDRKRKKRKQRPKSARNACSPILGEVECAKAFSDSAALRKVSRFSDDSSTSNSNVSLRNREHFLVERLDLKRIDADKDSLDTIADAREELPSEEALDVQSLGSDDTYTVDKDRSDGNDGSLRSSATFVIENEVPVPKPRKRFGRIEVM